MRSQKASRGEGSTGSPCFPDRYWHYWEELGAKNGFFLSFSSFAVVDKSVGGAETKVSEKKW